MYLVSMLNNENYGEIVVVIEHIKNIRVIQYEHPMQVNDENRKKGQCFLRLVLIHFRWFDQIHWFEGD